MKKLIKQTENYSIYEAEFMGLPQTFRHWKNDQVEIRFNDYFARANGYKSIDDMLNDNKGMREGLIKTCGMIPEWVTITDDGKFVVKNTQNDVSYN